MSKAKATHFGHCQVCGNKQKLPGGRLSLPGYEVSQWGFFNGVCNGARNLPFEQDISLIESSIRWAQERQASLEELAAKTRASRETVWVHEYIPSYRNGRRTVYSSYEWREFDVSDLVELSDWQVRWTGKDGKVKDSHLYMSYEEGANRDPIIHLNEARAKAYDQTVEEVKRYIRWQQERIQDWKPTELEPVNPVV